MRRKSTAQSDIKYSCGTFCMGKTPVCMMFLDISPYSRESYPQGYRQCAGGHP